MGYVSFLEGICFTLTTLTRHVMVGITRSKVFFFKNRKVLRAYFYPGSPSRPNFAHKVGSGILCMDHPKGHSLFGLGLPGLYISHWLTWSHHFWKSWRVAPELRKCAGKLLVHNPATKECFKKNWKNATQQNPTRNGCYIKLLLLESGIFSKTHPFTHLIRMNQNHTL